MVISIVMMTLLCSSGVAIAKLVKRNECDNLLQRSYDTTTQHRLTLDLGCDSNSQFAPYTLGCEPQLSVMGSSYRKSCFNHSVTIKPWELR